MIPKVMELQSYKPYIINHSRVIEKYLASGVGSKPALSTAVDFIKLYCDVEKEVIRLSEQARRSIIRAGKEDSVEVIEEIKKARAYRNYLLNLIVRMKKRNNWH